jgi:acyl carrier protein
MTDIEIKVKNIICEHLPSPPPNESLDDNTPLKLLGMNSISFIKTVLTLEEIFQIEFADEELDLDKFSTIGSLLRYIDDKTGYQVAE